MILRISEVLVAHDVARIEGEVSPTNSENIYILNKLGFVIRGNVASERWGNVIQFVKYLNPKNEKVFTDQFCFKKP